MANDLLNLNKQEIQKLQYDILWHSIENNGYLPASQIEILNKSLNTDSKVIIKAINEVLTKTTNSRKAINRFRERFNKIIGDNVGNPDIQADLDSLNGNVIQVMAALKRNFEEFLNGDYQDTVDELQNNITNLSNEVTDIQNELTTINEKLINMEVVVDTITEFSGNSFELSKIPIVNSNLEFFINGVRYNTSCFEVVDKICTFTYDGKDTGFDLNANDYEVVVKYNYVH